jgi:hypothetical protein
LSRGESEGEAEGAEPEGGEEAMSRLKKMGLAILGVAFTIFMYTKIGLLISAVLLVVVVIATAVGRPKDEQRRGL